MNNYAKIIVKGSPITKSNFKLFNLQGRAILPYNSGKYHDRYAIYEQEIAYEARVQNPNIVLSETLIAILKVYYKSKKRHPDTINITKSIFDGIEKSGVIINDAQIRRIIVEEFYDKENPRFELELFGESFYSIDYTIKKRDVKLNPIEYNISSNTPNKSSPKINKKVIDENLCAICGKKVIITDCFSANKGTMKICKECFKKSF
ncbi:crossover junction endodeoxyribonuclease RuvA [Clostridium tetani]|uniref:Crossover junction endodeoxyribonuclease RuvA n=1 Tax=Clostridium tetani TaxID=1513 RepID=A0ABC8EF27_CLOTA|nr:RusA family crossover junction endodeoxyribonuclease [Clostridium tetani]BDR68173.1 crossover junction endodeoxyribonuclease RuvA [Clostridium tetani]BDR70781.1 crossover junction endodeoxyribonuclease RuvA [Clostridium tetani]BDR73731.1 crossover junction endodeoxyribonuclease RuvA [Clostridium tetani]BDR82103.1 crossover junction endodeoxyribonuclease RuvA [Clostridium tetani]BDR90493.1 crossover junction endodeoxyribonuclease RuvA [Clostridium tetani]